MILFFLFYQCIKYAKIAAKEEKELFKIAVKTVTELSLYDNQTVCLKDIRLDNVRIFGQGVQKFVQLNLYTAL